MAARGRRGAGNLEAACLALMLTVSCDLQCGGGEGAFDCGVVGFGAAACEDYLGGIASEQRMLLILSLSQENKNLMLFPWEFTYSTKNI